MISLLNDYGEGAHPQILGALADQNLRTMAGYGQDEFCAQAFELIRGKIGCANAQVHLIPGGTLTNLIAIAGVLAPHQAVITARSGHICRHEAGAIEATGHKIIGTDHDQGKLCPSLVLQALKDNAMAPHMAQPKLVYVSQTTEFGTVYSRQELKALSTCCREYGLYLMVDGARLGTSLVQSDLRWTDLAEMADLFWIGGTKSGAMLGEALVIPSPEFAPHLPYVIKQRGAMMAKGRYMGIGFVQLMQDGLFESLGEHAVGMAQRLAKGVCSAGFELSVPAQSNMVFAKLPKPLVDKLARGFAFHVWEDHKHSSTIRLVTSWATTKEQVDAFVGVLA